MIDRNMQNLTGRNCSDYYLYRNTDKLGMFKVSLDYGLDWEGINTNTLSFSASVQGLIY